ncbi:MAG: hypothetical protein HQL73_06125 [Magnetococcales bacterium]|nr:hypothetical protein [Magnetococcales bacterium]
MKWHESLRIKIVTVILVSVLGMGVVFSYQSYLEARKVMAQQTSDTAHVFGDIVKSQIQVLGKDQSLVLESLLNDHALVNAFANQDRGALAGMLVEFYKERMRKEYEIDQFQFHLPPAISFFRVHQPDKFGDDLASFRQTVVVANQTQKPVVGLEVGRAGPGLRVVYPVFQGQRHIGSVELGGSLSQVFSVARSTTRLEFAIGIKEAVFNAAKRFANDQSDVKVDDTLYYDFSNPEVKQLVSMVASGDGTTPVLFGGKKWMTSSFPLQDYRGSEIGSVLLLNDVTALMSEASNRLIVKIAMILVLILGISTGLYVMMQRMVLNPVGDFVQATTLLAQGDLTFAMDRAHKGEFAVLREAMDTMMSTLRRLMGGIVGYSQGLSENANHLNNVAGDLEQGARELQTKGGKGSEIARTLNQNMTGVEEAVQSMSENMSEMLHSAQELNSNMATISAAAEEASASLGTVAQAAGKQSEGMNKVRGAVERSSNNVARVADALEEINSSLNGVKERCETAAVASDEAEKAVEANGAVMAQLEQSAREIMAVVGMIRDIAEQTNMLALNAAIEAAGAGDAGKGFAVVANEVKELARQTGDATHNIENKIQQIQDHTLSVNQAMVEMNQRVKRIRRANGDILGAMLEQSATVTDVARSMGEVADEFGSVSQFVGEVTQEVAEVTGSVKEIALGINEVTRNVSSASVGVECMTQAVEKTSAHGESINNLVAETVLQGVELTNQMCQILTAAEKLFALSASVTDCSKESQSMANLLGQELRQFKV